MAKNSPGWALAVTERKTDLDDLRCLLKAPFDPWVEGCDLPFDGEVLFLRSKGFPAMANSHDVRRLSEGLLKKIEGGLAATFPDAQTLKVVEVVLFDDKGARVPILVAGSGDVTIALGGVRARGRVGSLGQPAASPMQKILAAAAADPLRSGLLEELAAEDSWFQLYRVMEFLESIDGGEALKSHLGGERQFMIASATPPTRCFAIDLANTSPRTTR